MYKTPSSIQKLRAHLNTDMGSKAFSACTMAIGVSAASAALVASIPSMVVGASLAGVASLGVIAASKVPNVALKLREKFDPDGQFDRTEKFLERVENSGENFLDLGSDALREGVIDRKGFELCLRAEERRSDGVLQPSEIQVIQDMLVDGCHNKMDDLSHHRQMRI